MVDRSAGEGDLAERVAEAVRGGVDWVQVRDRQLEGAALLEHADRVAGAARGAAAESGSAVRVLVNRRADIALAIGADGVHLGFDAMAPAEARRALGDSALIGLSAHDPAELDAPGPVSYAQLAPIRAPLSKAATRPALGLEALTAAARRGIPVLAQGGVEAHEARAMIEAGAAGVAVTGAILLADSPRRAAAALREALDG